MRVLILLLIACHSSSWHPIGGDDADAGPDAPSGCPAGVAGAPCVLALYDAAVGCDPVALGKLRTELDARKEMGPLWSNNRALFRTDLPMHIAGEFNGWAPDGAATAAMCGSDLVVGIVTVPSGRYPYKLVDAQMQWHLDVHNPAFAYDDFSGNADGRNSVIDTPDSGLGHIVSFGQECSSALGNCRDITAYLPPGYDAPEAADRTYPVLFMHDGQNLWDDHTCCFGHTGWEINVLLDGEIAAHKVAPIVVIGAASTTARNDEYGLTPSTMTTFMQFQVTQLQPHALTKVRWDQKPVAIAGSSLGGLVAMHLGLAYPATYSAIASLSGAFWPGQDTHTALRDQLPSLGKHPLAVYLDSGGDPAQNTDGAQDTIDVRDLMMTMGWRHADSPACTRGPDAVCYHLEAGATHDELAWKARAWRFVEFLFPG